MNFATMKGLTIPEGVVTKITDASGRVLWSAVPMVTIVITKPSITEKSNADYAKVTVNGQVYDGSTTVSLLVPVGTSIQCDVVTAISGSMQLGGISLNGDKLGLSNYNYTVTSNCTIEVWMISMMHKYGNVRITET